jgi:hypothetical protein
VLEKMADALSDVQEGEDFARRFSELCGDLTKKDLLALAAIHRRRAEESTHI